MHPSAARRYSTVSQSIVSLLPVAVLTLAHAAVVQKPAFSHVLIKVEANLNRGRVDDLELRGQHRRDSAPNQPCSGAGTPYP